ncbi:hypothetical protein niasHT_011584 [Heterodera trifolii]|uniref:F-box domain-containing protein n=1 Tax=Heterodera trifolii TaxID=157864 RepID=A0ABD2L7W5_9BILA
MAHKRKRQNKDAPCSSTNSDLVNQCSFPIDQLPLNALVIVASQLPFKDFKRIGTISKQFQPSAYNRQNVFFRPSNSIFDRLNE